MTPAPLNVRVTLAFPSGVPGLPFPPGGPVLLLLLPPPHEPIATTEVIASTARIALQRRRREAQHANKTAMHKTQANPRLPRAVRFPKAAGRLFDCGNAAERAVVWKVTVAVPVVVVALRDTEGTLQLQVVSLGRPEQTAGESGIVPVNVPKFENVTMTEPLPPGLLITTEVVLGIAINVGWAVTTSAVEAVDVA